MSRSPRNSRIVASVAVVAAGLFLSLTQCPPAQGDGAFEIDGWSELVLSVSDLQRHARFYREIAGWEQRAAGPLDAQALAGWCLDPEMPGRQALFGNPGTVRGFVRLVRFEAASQVQIRSNAQAWEAGGILDFNVRVPDMERKFTQMQADGWLAHSDPLQFRFGPFVVNEWIAVGPDGASLALIERVEPPLEGWPQLRDFSRTFNSTQVVKDFEAARSFYQDVLGFREYLSHEGPSPAPGENVLGLPWEVAASSPRRVWIGSPAGDNEGSVELLAFDGLSGRHFGERAVPPNLGMLMLRFPIRGIDAFAEHLAKHGVEPVCGIHAVDFEPHGPARQLSIRAPDGAWLDFYETARD
ncbi:MAG: VOC family protein [Gammaproteobacteria bacterium]